MIGSVTFGIALVAAVAAYFTPETKGTSLADLGQRDPVARALIEHRFAMPSLDRPDIRRRR